MKFSVAVAAAALFAGVQGYANGTTTYTTEVVTAYTTYCPEPTTITHGDKTYTVTSATTLTITNCPCTITKPVITATVTKCNGGCGPKPSQPPVYGNGTTPVVKPTASATGTVSKPPVFTDGAARAASGAGFAALLGFAALVL